MRYFQGAKNHKNYFEGFYFKCSDKKDNIAIIPGIAVSEKEKYSFIQIITNQKSYYFKFPYEDFYAEKDKFFVQIKNNIFTNEFINLDIKEQKCSISGKISLSKFTPLKKEIMGFFKKIPFLPCYHQILSMKHLVHGKITINKETLVFQEGNGYIEKDYGHTFPKNYRWIQANNFQEESLSLALAIAHVPISFFSIQGFFCIIKNKDQEFIFATYNRSKIKAKEDGLIILRKGKYRLVIEYLQAQPIKLTAPNQGEMKDEVYESINSALSFKLYKKDQVILSGESQNVGIEIV